MDRLIRADKNSTQFSVSGNLYDLIKVGIPANKSAKILKIIAILASFDMYHAISPETERAPHTISNRVSFQ